MSQSDKLIGKKAIVTGGTRGIGFSIAALFIEAGADVLILGTNEERGGVSLSELKKLARLDGQKVDFKKIDVASYSEVDILSSLETPDILVNCAGITRDKLFIRMAEEDWDLVLDTNLKSVYNMTHAVLRGMMKKQGGHIINITSVVGIMGNPGQVNYAASKAGMIGFTKSLAKEVASRGVLVNCIAPGFIETEMTGKLSSEQKEKIMGQVPLARLGRPEDIAEAALFLATSKYITGQTIVVDGGMTA